MPCFSRHHNLCVCFWDKGAVASTVLCPDCSLEAYCCITLNGRILGYQLAILMSMPRNPKKGNAYVVTVVRTKPPGRPAFFVVKLKKPIPGCSLCPFKTCNVTSLRSHFRCGHGTLHPLKQALLCWREMGYDEDLASALARVVPFPARSCQDLGCLFILECLICLCNLNRFDLVTSVL
jgi:hypothetical protein